MDNHEQTASPQEQKSDMEKGRDIFTGIALRGAVSLQSALGLNEDTFRMVVGHTHQDARAYYLYGVLDEVLKAATAMLRWQGFLSDSEKDRDQLQEIPKKAHGNHLMRVVHESVQDEQHLWSRKLAELLSDLLLFKTTNNQEYFRLFLTCEHLDAYLGLQRDFGDFFSCKNLNAEESIRSLVSIVKQCARSIDLKKVWFLNDSIRWDKPLKAGNLFCSNRARYRLALKNADADQKMVLGISYESAYSVPSRSIHANIGGPPIEVDRKTIERAFHHISLFCPQIILQAHKLTGVPLTGDTEFVDKMLKSGTDARTILESIYGKELEVGDIVFAYSKDLCVVVDKSKSEFGYTSYKVRYLSPPLLSEVPEDWFPARYVHLVCPKNLVREKMIEIFEKHHLLPDAAEMVRNMPEKDLLDQMVSTALAAYEEGAFDRMFPTKTDR